MPNYVLETKLVGCVSNRPNTKHEPEPDPDPEGFVYFSYPRIIEKRRRSKCSDRISSLPDEILVDILSLLKDTREATRTSVLSKKWQHLWHNVQNYDFSSALTVPGFHLKDIDFKLKYSLDKAVGSKVAYCVNKALHSSRASSINRFKVHSSLDRNYNHSISEWLHFAMTKSVKELKFNFSAFGGLITPKYPTFPCLSRYANSPSVHTLVSLTLGALHVSAGFLESIFFIFTNLEHLTMKSVSYKAPKSPGSFQKNMKSKVVCSLPKLRHLEISWCYGFGQIEISAAKLTSFVYYGFSTEDIYFSYVPLLNDATFRGNYECIFNDCTIYGLSRQLSRLKLVIEFKDFFQLPFVVANQFGNLKELELMFHGNPTESLLSVTCFIDACPLLHKLKVQRELPNWKLESDLSKWNWKESRNEAGFVAMKHHHCLNIFEMVGFLGAKVDIELILLLAQEAIPLEKIILDPTQRCERGKPRPSKPSDLIEIGRKEAKLLRNHIPSRVEMEVL